jgi:gas vesicle protein
MKRSTAFLAGLGIGGAMMYMLDPDRGRERRGDIKEGMHRTRESLRRKGEKVRQTSQRVSARIIGLKENARSILGTRRLSDTALMARVRLHIGQSVSHPKAIDVRVEDGLVRLSGPILESEVNKLLRSVSGIRGVNCIENRLEVHPVADIPELQGEAERVA